MKYRSLIGLLFLLLIQTACYERPDAPGQSVESYEIPVADLEETDRLTVYFTSPDNSADPDDLESSPVGKGLVELIRKQSSGTMYICFYDFDYQPVIDALLEAMNKGVAVYFVGDVDEDDDAGYTALIAEINSSGGSEQETIGNGEDAESGYSLIYPDYIMHNKFALITDSETGSQYVWTGSTNVSESGMVYNNNNSIIVQSSDMYDLYEQQFKFLYDGSAKPVSELTTFSVGNIQLSVLFSYKDSGREYEELPVSYLASLVDTALSQVFFMMFTFTNTVVSSALENRSAAGVAVQGILDTSQSHTNGDVIDSFTEAGLDFRYDGNGETDPANPLGGGKFHHKCMIIDPDSLTNALVVTGSTNATNNANDGNAENMVIIYSQTYAAIYKEEFEGCWSEATAEGRGYLQ